MSKAEDNSPEFIYRSAIILLWRNWTLCVGIVMAIVVMAVEMPLRWLPVAVFSLELVVYAMVRRNRATVAPTCYLLPFVMTRVLFWSGTVIVILNLCASSGLYDSLFATWQYEMPFIPILVIAPVMVAVTAWAAKLKYSIGFCVDCRMRHGTPAERGFLGRLFSQEGAVQVRSLLIITSALCVVCYLYYFFAYLDAGFSSSDMFFFVWLPVIFYGVSIVFMGVRYFGLWAYYEHNAPLLEFGKPSATTIRFLIFTSDSIFLTDKTDMTGANDGDSLYDTPAVLLFPYRHKPPINEERRYFRDLSGIDDFEIRFMYVSCITGSGSKVYHYIVTLENEKAVEGSRLEGSWFSMQAVELMLNQWRLNPMLAAEIYRLYTVTMAWKTYDRAGRRRYAIKNYRPTFHLSDIVNWDVDFNDPHWLYVATNNQDSRFYSIRRLWRRYVNGLKE